MRTALIAAALLTACACSDDPDVAGVSVEATTTTVEELPGDEPTTTGPAEPIIDDGPCRIDPVPLAYYSSATGPQPVSELVDEYLRAIEASTGLSYGECRNEVIDSIIGAPRRDGRPPATGPDDLVETVPMPIQEALSPGTE